MFRLSFPYIYIYTHVSDIKNKKRMCSFSFNGLDEMNKTKCLQEITTIYYKWNILLVSSVLVEIMFRWINIMSSYFFFFLHVFIYCLMLDILHCHQITSSFFSNKSEVHHLIIIEIIFSHYTSPYHKKESWLCLSIRTEDKRCAKKAKEIFKLDKHKLSWIRQRKREREREKKMRNSMSATRRQVDHVMQILFRCGWCY
jgi:hypothetical protein